MRVCPLLVVAALGCGRVGFDASGGGDNLVDAAPSDALGGDGLAMPDGPGADAAAAGARFTNLAPANAPAARRSSGAAIESTTGRDRIWIFGGFNGSGFRNDLHAYDSMTNAWTAIAGSGTPTARERHSLAWDPAGNAVVLFGGQFAMVVNFTHFDALYVFRPATMAWTQIPKAGAWPAARKDAAFVYVPHLGKFLLYGGNNGTGAGTRFSDLWLLTLDAVAGTGSWTQLAPGGAAAPAQSAGCVVYDPAGRRLLVFGGEVQDSSAVTTTYQYLVDTNVWQLDTTTGTVPPGASFNQCAWDPTLARIVLYGGQDTNGQPLAGTYAYDPSTKAWSTVPTQPASPTPGVRADGAAVYSPAHGGVFWYGGRTALATYTSESWVLDVQ